jgi:UDP:flavonoid glycosyltransferase YjiC (YdhE family)
MRVLFAVSAWPGHYYAMVPLGWALQAAGHEVRVACAPSQTEAVTRSGLTPAPVLEGMDMVFLTRVRYLWDAQAERWPYPWRPIHPVTGDEVASLTEFDITEYYREHPDQTIGAMVRGFDGAVRLARAWRPDLVVHDPLGVDGQLAAAAIGVPAAVHLWGPVGTHEDPEHGLSIVPSYPAGTFAKWGVGDLGPDAVRYVIDPCPAELAPPVAGRRLPVRFVPYNGPGELPDWLLAEPKRPRVCVVWGTSITAMSGPRAFLLPEIVEAAAGLDAEVVVTATAEALAALGPLPPNVRAVEKLPLHLLLPSCAAVVHHGGAGSVMTALDAGVPQLAVTFAIEQQLNGERIAATGAGAHLPAHQADVYSVRAAVGDMLARPGYRQAAERLRSGCRQRPSPARLVAELAELAEPAADAA